MSESRLSHNQTLKNGNHVHIRPIRPDDASKLQDLVTRLSPESIYFRFLEYLKGLSDKQAQDFATVDYKKRMAYVAVIEDRDREKIIGVARYGMTNPDQPGSAEVGIVIDDAYQNLGLGTLLMKHLVAFARQNGVRIFVASISPANQRILNFIKRSGLTVKRRFNEGVWEMIIQL